MNHKTIKSQDGKIEINYADVQNVCIVFSLYALLQYLLLQDENTIKSKTCYFFSSDIRHEIAQHLPAIVIQSADSFLKKRLQKIELRYLSFIRFPFLKHAKIFAQDHCLPALLIANRNYSLLSDGPLCLTNNQYCDLWIKVKSHASTIKGKFETLVYGDLATHIWGSSQYCSKVYMTEQNPDVPIEKQKILVESLSTMWSRASQSHKDFILRTYNISTEDLELMQLRPFMFMSQPIVKDGYLNEIEYVDLLNEIFDRYGTDQIIVKAHPRDTFNYEKYYPNITLFRKPINVQLLVLNGALPQKAFTLFSSSINAFPDCVEVDWYGTGVHPKIAKRFSQNVIPNRTCNMITLNH